MFVERFTVTEILNKNMGYVHIDERVYRSENCNWTSPGNGAIMRIYTSILGGMTVMNNEEKILEILTAMQADISELKADVAELKTDVAELKADVAELKVAVAKLNEDMVEVKEKIDTINEAIGIIVEWIDEAAIAIKIPLVRDEMPNVYNLLRRVEAAKAAKVAEAAKD
jgi:regulator of replication initiation timing